MRLSALASAPVSRDLQESALAWICEREAPRPTLVDAIPGRFVNNACQLNLKGESMKTRGPTNQSGHFTP